MTEVKKFLPCDPEQYAQDFDRVLDDLKRERNYNDEELDGKRTCLLGYLNDYIDFASASTKTRTQVERLYNKTLKMIDGAFVSRGIQENEVSDMLGIMEEDLSQNDVEFNKNNEPIYKEEYSYSGVAELFDQWNDIEEVLRSFDGDRRELDKIKNSCLLANNQEKKVICIETFVSATHSRGHYLATGCELPMPEQNSERDYSDLTDLGREANDLTDSVLDCLARK